MNKDERPKIFGLSASLLNEKCKPGRLLKRMRELEGTMLSAITTASEISDIRKYGTNPDEYAVYYADYKSSASDFIEEVNQFTNQLIQRKHKLESENTSNVATYCDTSFLEKCTRCFLCLSETLCSLGPWCGYKAAEIYKQEFENLLYRQNLDAQKSILLEVQRFLDYFMNMCLSLNGGSDEVHFDLMPHKLKRLLEIFTAMKRSKRFSKNFHVCGIIFVQRQITAYILSQWLEKIKDVNPKVDFLKPDFIVGNSSGGVSGTSMSETAQKQKIRAFRDQQCNILVATSVLEEGMDIPQCNLVVRFDIPPDFRAYVQSKGRARAKNSIYVLMIKDGPESNLFLEDLVHFKTIEKIIASKSHDRSIPTKEEIAECMPDDIIPPYAPYGKTQRRIRMYSAISLINRYCAVLPCDMSTNLVPQWWIETDNSNNTGELYTCQLRMPINSALRQVIQSEPMKQKKLAKMSAALKACKLLHEMGELNEHFVPISCYMQKAIEEELKGDAEDEYDDDPSAGTSKRIQLYDKHVPIFLKNAKPIVGKKCFLHVINMTSLDEPNIIPKSNEPYFDPSNVIRKLGLLCSSRLPPVNTFPLFTKFCKLSFSVEFCNNPVELNEEELCNIEQFHKFVFSDVLYLEEGKVFSPSQAEATYYVVPVDTTCQNELEVDWNLMRIVANYINHKQKGSLSPIITDTFGDNSLKDAVLLRSYAFKTSDRSTFHHVVRIRKDMSPASLTDFEPIQTFKQYYLSKHEIQIKLENQPLIETVQLKSLKHWRPCKKLENTVHRQKHREYLVPELCIIHPFSSTFLLEVMCLPYMLYRLNGLLVAEELRQAVSTKMGIGSVLVEDSQHWPPLQLERKGSLFLNTVSEQSTPENSLLPQDIKKNEKDISSFVIRYDLQSVQGPDPSLILQALTAKSAGDAFDLERLETIGDSFLKYVMSLKLFMKYPSFDEGKLTSIRSKLIKNSHLYQKAKLKKLGEYLSIDSFDCHKNWMPPCYVIDEETNNKATDDEESTYLHFTKQEVSDKSIADSVESLIGSYLLTTGPIGAIKFMAWFNLNPLANSKDDFKNWPPPPPSPFIPEALDPQQRLPALTDSFERFEDKIGYKFSNKAYLLQALTHPSYIYNEITDCYQRLEFLGDAILDYLITRQLFEDPKKHSPGELTDLRSALVNNTLFASLAVLHEYEKFLLMLSPSLFGLIRQYVDILKTSDGYKFFETYKYNFEESECLELDEVEVPKALGDVFESVAGAIYLDSGMSLDAVWKVYFPMLKSSLDHLSHHVPKNPVRELYEMVPGLKFGEHFEQRGKTHIEVLLPDGRKYTGIGSNKKVAKRSAAKRAVLDMKSAAKKATLDMKSVDKTMMLSSRAE